MAQFELNWFNAAVLISPNAISQRALYRQKSVGGAFISTGFTPANDLPKTASQTLSPDLAENVIWEFKVQAICTEGGPTDNDNGIIELLEFECLTPILSQDVDSATITLNVLGLDITKARFTLHFASDNTVADGPTTVNKVGNSISYTATGIDPGTDYYWEIELYSTVGGVEIVSSSLDQLGFACQSDVFSTDEDICAPCTDLDVSSIEL